MIHKEQDLEPSETFLDFLQQFQHPTILAKLDVEIERLTKEIDQNLKDRNVTKNDLDRVRQSLVEQKKQLIKHQNDLKSYFERDEVAEIQKFHDLCNEKDILVKQILLLNKFFSNRSEIPSLLAKVSMENHQYYESYQCIARATDIYETMKKNEPELFPRLAPDARYRKDVVLILEKLQQQIQFKKEEFLYNLIKLFKKNVYFEKLTNQDQQRNNATTTTSKIFRFEFTKTMSPQQYESFIKCILEERCDFHIYFANIFDVFNQEFLAEILQNKKKAVVVSDDENQVRIIKLVDIDQNDDSEVDCLKNLENFIEIVLNLFTLDRSIRDVDEIITYIGEIWSEKIFTTVIDNYFERSLPKLESELHKFWDLIERGKMLESRMRSMGMTRTESVVFEEYSQNIKNHFSTKLCQDFVVRMKKILKQPQQHYSSEEVLRELSLSSKSKFAHCQISDYMIEVKNLFEEMAALLSNSSENLKLLLNETIYLVCELFIAIAPYRYRDLIETDCKQNAIFHNNCLFFGHLIECLTLTQKPSLDQLYELVPCIRNIAGQIFFNQMKFQEKWLRCFIQNETFDHALQVIVNEIPSTDLSKSSQSHFEFRECLNNCLKHLNHLHNSFVGVLPKKISDKIFSTLISVLLKHFIEKILSLDDISSLGSSHLYNEIDYFTKELKLFLVDADEVIYKWMKLNEINFLLKSSLLEILNRWADGRGLLATYLKPDEVRHMIRALFQNNERRANVLAKIK